MDENREKEIGKFFSSKKMIRNGIFIVLGIILLVYLYKKIGSQHVTF